MALASWYRWSRRRLHKSRWSPKRSLAIAIVVLLTAWLDILGLNSHLQAASDDMTARLQSATSLIGRKKADQRQVSVVLIDPAYMQGEQGRSPDWPLPVNDFLLNILQPVIDAGPSAVFIDISFTDIPRPLNAGGAFDRNALRKLGDGIRNAAQEVPILVANSLPLGEADGCKTSWTDIDALGAAGTTSQEFRDALMASPSKAQMVAVNWLGQDGEYPLSGMIASRAGSCPAVSKAARDVFRGADARHLGAGYLLSPAVALLQTACAPRPGGSVPAICVDIRQVGSRSGYSLYALNDALLAPMKVIWKTNLSPMMRERIANSTDAKKCHWQQDSVLTGIVAQGFRTFVPGLADAWLGKSYFDLPCFAIDTISAADARQSLRDDPGSDAYHKFVLAVRGRVVMIGADLPTVPDRVRTPLGVDMPGVFLHAMAAENLLDEGAGYFRPPGVMGGMVAAVVEGLIVALFGLAITRLMARLDRGHLVPAGHAGKVVHFTFMLLLASLTVFLLAVCFLFFWPYVGSPMLVASGVIVVVTENLRQFYFPHQPATNPVLHP